MVVATHERRQAGGHARRWRKQLCSLPDTGMNFPCLGLVQGDNPGRAHTKRCQVVYRRGPGRERRGRGQR